MSASSIPSLTPQFNTRSPTVQSGNTILLRLPNGDTKAVKIEKDRCAARIPFLFFCSPEKNSSSISLGRLGVFHGNELINEPFGRTYDIIDKKLKLVPPRTLAEVGASLVNLNQPRF